MAVGAVRFPELGKLRQQGVLALDKTAIRLRVNAQRTQGQDDLGAAFRVLIAVGDIPAGVRQLAGKISKRCVDLGLQPVPIGGQCLHRHSGDVHIRFSGDQAEAAVRLLSNGNGIYHVLSGIPCIVRDLRILGIQSQQRPYPAI